MIYLPTWKVTLLSKGKLAKLGNKQEPLSDNDKQYQYTARQFKFEDIQALTEMEYHEPIILSVERITDF